MKKILLLTWFLLTLLPIMNFGNFSSLSAQNYTYENGSWWLPDIDVKSENVKCAVCGHLYDPKEQHTCSVKCECCKQEFDDPDALNRHIRTDAVCGSYYGNNDKDNEIDAGCYLCGLPLDQCRCQGAESVGSADKSTNDTTNGRPSSGKEEGTNTSPVISSGSTTTKGKVSQTKLVSTFKSSKYNRTYDRTVCGYCLRGWKTVWRDAGLGEYANTRYAKDFGDQLLRYGFKLIYSGNQRPPDYIPQVGDTRIWDTYPGQSVPAGHIDWWNGKNWVSDYVLKFRI